MAMSNHQFSTTTLQILDHLQNQLLVYDLLYVTISCIKQLSGVKLK